LALEAARFQMSNDDAGYDKGLQDGWSEAIRSSGGRADVPMAKSGTSGREHRKGLLKGFMEAAEAKVRSGGGGGGGDAGFDKGLQDGWSEAVRASGGRADVPMAKSGKSGTEYRKGLDRGFTEAAEEKRRSEGGSEKKRDSSGGGSGPKVLKKGAAGHGGGKKKRRRY